MSREDPLASPTLAQLYVTQGHYARALKVLDAVLAEDPLNGHALALQQRLARRRRARVELAVERGQLRVRYDHAHEGMHPIHVVIAAWSRASGWPVAEPVRSVRCDGAQGSLELPAPRGHGSACACLATLDPAGGLRVLAVAPALTW